MLQRIGQGVEHAASLDGHAFEEVGRGEIEALGFGSGLVSFLAWARVPRVKSAASATSAIVS